MAPAGRTKHPVWDKFKRIESGKGFKAECKLCGVIMMGIVKRMLNHVCPNAPPEEDGGVEGDPPSLQEGSSGQSQNRIHPSTPQSAKKKS